MATSGGQPGNKNARKSRLFEQALTREIKQRDLEAGDGETLRLVAGKMVDNALSGDRQAITDLRDTLDGKPTMAVEHASDPDNPLLPDQRIADFVFESVLKRLAPTESAPSS